MSFKYEREKTSSTPYILIDEEKHYMKVDGKWYLEDIVSAFKDINDWLQRYFQTNFDHFTLDCSLEYFNSSATKVLYNMLLYMDSHSNENNKVTVNWIALEDDEMLIECGEDFAEDMENLTFNIVLKKG